MKKLPHIRDMAEAIDPKLAYIYKRPAKKGESIDKVTCCS